MGYASVILHVGMGKTGTSTIQSFLDRNRENLLKAGFLYLGPYDLVSYSQEGEFWQDGLLDRGLDEINQKTGGGSVVPSLIWSREALSNYMFVKESRNIARIKECLPASEHQVIVYLRRQDHWIRSAYLQWGVRQKVYAGRTLSFEEWLDRFINDGFDAPTSPNLDYYALVRPWVETFQAANVIVRPLERDQLMAQDLLRDFHHNCYIPGISYDFNIPNQNVSYNVELHDLLGMYNAVFDEPRIHWEMMNWIDDLATDPFFLSAFFSQFRIAPRARIRILERFEESNRRVAREFLGRQDGVLFREPWPSPDEPYEPYGGMTLGRLVPILMHVLLRQNQQMTRSQAQLLEMCEEIRKIQEVMGLLGHDHISSGKRRLWETVRASIESIRSRLGGAS